MQIADYIYRMLKDNRGFTLIELGVVVAIAGVLAAIGIPLSLWTPSRALRSTTRQLWTEIHLARRKSINENKGFILEYAGAENRFKLWKDEDNDCIVDNPGDTEFWNYSIYREIARVSAANICFRPTGSANAVTIKLENIEGTAQDIAVSAIGVPKVNDPYSCGGCF